MTTISRKDDLFAAIRVLTRFKYQCQRKPRFPMKVQYKDFTSFTAIIDKLRNFNRHEYARFKPDPFRSNVRIDGRNTRLRAEQVLKGIGEDHNKIRLTFILGTHPLTPLTSI